MQQIQGIFDFESGNSNGINNWYQQQDAIKEKIRQKWGLPLEKNVLIKLYGIDENFSGRLKLTRTPIKISRKEPIQLRIGDTEFLSTDIEQCIAQPIP